MAWLSLRFTVCLLALLGPTTAQLSQDYIANDVPNANGQGSTIEYFYQPLPNDVPRQVVNLSPEFVYLIYNCYYMRDICKNAYNFQQSHRGRYLHLSSELPTSVYGYDFNTGKESSKRSTKRRKQSCPSARGKAWKDSHPCPETNQREVMRHDGAWFSRDLEPGTSQNEIMNKRGANNQITEYSGVRYTCDEFPAATWVEGGNGIAGDGPSETRCAAFRCMANVKAEQNWQAEAHGKLREQLESVTRRRMTHSGHFPFFDNTQSVVLFSFAMETIPNGIAARVVVYQDPDLSVVTAQSTVSQAKRQSANATAAPNWRSGLTAEQLSGLVRTGQASESVVAANDSFVYVSMSDLTGTAYPMTHMGSTGLKSRWDLDESASEDSAGPNSTLGNMQAPRPKPEPAPLSKHVPGPRSAPKPRITPRLKAASAADLERARSIVEQAIAESSKLNKARLENPLRNQYRLKPGTVVGQEAVHRRSSPVRPREVVPPLLEITDEMADAAALIAEAEAGTDATNVTRRAAAAATGTYWMGALARKGTVPWGDDPSYVVFRNVLDYGAVGDGVTDDTKAIKKALTDGKRCGAKCNGSTTKNAIVYFPPGTYLVSSQIPLPFGTQLIGDANNRPRLVASKSFIGSSVLSTDEYTGGGKGTDGLDQQYYVNTANFYRQIRNIVVDVTATRAAQQVSCLHYQVAQATSLQNVELIAGPSQRGIFAENGSGGQISDVTFRGGAVGLYGGNQQFTAQRLTFDGCTVGVQIIWDWGWVWKSITMTNVGVGFKLVPESSGGSGTVGSASFLDSSFTNVKMVVQISPPSSKPKSGSTGVVLENVALSGVAAAVADTTGKTLLDGSVARIDHWALGAVYEGSADGRSFSEGAKVGAYRRHSTLMDANGAYFERPKPQYADRAVADFVHLKDFGAKGDGVTDDTAAFQAALYASLGKILFVDAGSYILTSTVTVPSGSKLVGETWSQLVASGPYFQDASKPKVMIRVGNRGDVGNVELQDLLFTTRGPTPGAVLVEWNIQAESPGSAGLWDCHARIGGATGTELTPAECPATHAVDTNKCGGASLMMHLTPLASGYFENMWLWVADHMIDDPDWSDANNTMVQTSIFVARGFLIESTKATWLYGTASEHAVFYQYNLNRARNLYAGMLQTESPYFQPAPPPPAPFTAVIGVFPSDPTYRCGNDFDGCDESWAVIIRQSGNIFVAGAGLYSWFSDYGQDCIDQQACQKALVLLDSNFANVRFQHLVTIGAKYMAVMDGKGISAADNLAVNAHPFWSHVSVLDVASNGTHFAELVWIDPAIWDMEQPRFTCSPPCNVKIPPWTRATSTVNYPLMTVSDGSWTSTITKPPVTISEWVFEVVTLTAAPAGRNKRQPFQDFWPVLATTASWPVIIYTGPNGEPTTTAPTGAFPTPPPSIGPDAAAPPSGSWPKRAIQPIQGNVDNPWVAECSFFDLMCTSDPSVLGQPWKWGNVTGDPTGSGGGFDENWEDALTMCLPETSSSSSVSQPKPTSAIAQPQPAPSPREGDPGQNGVECYGSGQKTEHARLDSTANDFCNEIGKPGVVLDGGFTHQNTWTLPVSTGLGVKIVVSLDIAQGCQWTWNYDECRRYLNVPVDACNCGGVDGKQGGSVHNDCYWWRIDPNTAW